MFEIDLKVTRYMKLAHNKKMSRNINEVIEYIMRLDY